MPRLRWGVTVVAWENLCLCLGSEGLDRREPRRCWARDLVVGYLWYVLGRYVVGYACLQIEIGWWGIDMLLYYDVIIQS